MKHLEKTLLSAPAWMSGRPGEDIVMASIGRLVRNLRGHAFPGWSTAEGRAAVAESVIPAVRSLPGLARETLCAEMSELDYERRRALLAGKLLTPCMAARGEGCHLILPRRRHLACFVNEEEHIVFHAFRSGDSLSTVLSELRRIGAGLAERLPLAYDSAQGYRTSLPSEAGDGLQLYQVLHLPALTMAGMVPQITRAAEKLHVSISPFYSDGNDDTGNTYVFFSIPGPEGSTGELTAYFMNVMAHLCQRERQVRIKLMENSAEQVTDCIGRAYGLLRHARRLSLKELRDAASVLRMATVIGHIIWEDGADEGIAALRELCRLISVETALTPESMEEALPALRAAAARRFMAEHPHHFNTLYES